MKRGDKVRAMTDEQIAHLLASVQKNVIDQAVTTFTAMDLMTKEEAKELKKALPGLDTYEKEWVRWIAEEVRG